MNIINSKALYLFTGLSIAFFNIQVFAENNASAQARANRVAQSHTTKAVSPQVVKIEKKSNKSNSSACNGQGCNGTSSILNNNE